MHESFGGGMKLKTWKLKHGVIILLVQSQQTSQSSTNPTCWYTCFWIQILQIHVGWRSCVANPTLVWFPDPSLKPRTNTRGRVWQMTYSSA